MPASSRPPPTRSRARWPTWGARPPTRPPWPWKGWTWPRTGAGSRRPVLPWKKPSNSSSPAWLPWWKRRELGRWPPAGRIGVLSHQSRWLPSFFRGTPHLEDDCRDVVDLGRVLAERLNRIVQVIDDEPGRIAAVDPDEVEGTAAAEEGAVGAEGFGDSVGEQQDDVAGRQGQGFAAGDLGVVEDAEGDAGAIQAALDGATGVEEVACRVAGAG